MIVKINGTDYAFKTSFYELTFAEYLPMLLAAEKPAMERLSIYTGIAVDLLSQLQLQYLAYLTDATAFAENTDILNALAQPYDGTYVGLETFGKMETAKRRLKDKTILEAIPEIVKVYTGRDISNEPLCDVWHLAMFYVNSVSTFFNRYRRLSEHTYSDEELEAGVEIFEGFGHFTTVVKIGRERGLTNDEVLNLSAEEVYMELLLDFERTEFEKNLHRIYKEREEHFAKVR